MNYEILYKKLEDFLSRPNVADILVNQFEDLGVEFTEIVPYSCIYPFDIFNDDGLFYNDNDVKNKNENLANSKVFFIDLQYVDITRKYFCTF